MEVNLKCDQCGGDLIELKNVPGTYICVHCGNKKLITNDISYNNYGVINNYYNIVFGDNSTSECLSEEQLNFRKRIESNLVNKKWEIVYEMSVKYTKDYVNDYFGWWIRSIASLELDRDEFFDYINKTFECADREKTIKIKSELKEILKLKLRNLIDHSKLERATRYLNLYEENYGLDKDCHIFNFEIILLKYWLSPFNLFYSCSNKAKDHCDKAISLTPTIIEQKVIKQRYDELMLKIKDSKRASLGVLLIIIMFAFAIFVGIAIS